ncbi:hypothetical protein ACIQWB_11870 [Streptomyces olivaceus]|uniref:hypothetical protein n=1 Tax=Streptomyces olivaceus TaxID=47716 RepID=UPI003801B1DB
MRGNRGRSARCADRLARGVSAYLEKAAQRQIERDNLDELIADFDEVHGPADPEAVAAKRVRLTGGATNAGAAA